jgi:hypothetical protein
MPEEYYDTDFPNLRTEGWQRTSEPDTYNCIAFAAGDTSRYWWPNLFLPNPSDDFWPEGVPNALTIEAFVQAFATRGYIICADANLESGFEKVAIYVHGGLPRHAALQQNNGKWRSKLGRHEDIETTLDGLAGPCYGVPTTFMKRPRAGS